jgi:hypothetical protein
MHILPILVGSIGIAAENHTYRKSGFRMHEMHPDMVVTGYKWKHAMV